MTSTPSPPSASFPIEAVRSRFPAVRSSERVFMDNPAGTQLPAIVIDAVRRAMEDDCANLGGRFPESRRAGAIYDAAHAKAAAFVGALTPVEIAIGSSMTELTYRVAQAVGRRCRPGDEIIVTTMDHEGNVSPWLAAARDFGLKARWVRFDEESWRVEPDDFAAALTDRTRLVALSYASNMTGSINDIRALAALAREAGALVYVDAVQFAPHDRIDVGALGCDFLVCSSYKFFGPHLGVLWGREAELAALDVDRLRCGPTGPGEKFERGTPQIELLAGLSAAVDYFVALGGEVAGETEEGAAISAAFAAGREYEDALTRRLLAGLAGIPSLSVKGITAQNRMRDRVPTVSVVSETGKNDMLARRLGNLGINVWSGHNYAYASAMQLGLDLEDGVLRIGMAHYNTIEEIDRLLAALDDACRV